MAYKLKDFPPDVQKRIKDQLAIRPSNVEQCSFDAVAAEIEMQKANPYFSGPVHITIHSKRRRLTDSDAVCGKYAIDSLVDCAIIRDDGPKYVKSVTFTQEKSNREETIITIEEI